MQRLKFPSRRRGFSFTEVLFAVVILGIGFIMVAGIFPVAIQQSKLTIDETTGAAIARGSVSYLQRAMTDNAGGTGATNCPPAQEGTLPATQYGIVQQLSYVLPNANASLVTALRGSQVLPEDPRYAFVGLYRRGGISTAPDSAAQLYVFAVQFTVGSVYNAAYDANTPTAAAPENNLMAHEVEVAVAHNVTALGGVDLIAFNTGCTDGANAAENRQLNYNVTGTNGTGAPVEGGYVVIAQDRLTGNNLGSLDGRIFKLGARRSDLDPDFRSYFPATLYNKLPSCQIFELDPSNNFVVDGGVDGIVKKYKNPTPPAADDVLGLGNSAGLSIDLPTSSTNSTLVTVQMTPTCSNTARAYVVGRSFADPRDPNAGNPLTDTKGFDGGSMVVGLYTTFVKIN